MIRNVMLAIAAALAAGRVAGAAVVDTPPMQYGPDGIWCLVLNHGDDPISGTLQFFNQAGVRVRDFGISNLPPHQMTGLGLPPSIGGTQGFCRFEGKFRKKAVKMTLCSQDGNIPCAQAVNSD